MVVSTTEFKENMGYYLNVVSENEIFISKNGKIIAKLTGLVHEKQEMLDSLVGITAHNPVSLDEAKKARLARQ